MKYQIIVDSSSDLTKDYLDGTGIGFAVAPLTVRIGEQEFVDDENIDVKAMLDAFNQYDGKTGSACPPPDAFAKAFDDADHTFIVTITSRLSGCYNSALVAANGSPDKKVHVVDSRAVSGSMVLIVDKLVELINSGLEFEEIVTQIEEYRKNVKLFFVLQCFDNLVQNGRMSKFAGFVAKHLSIRPVSIATDEGVIKVITKTIGTLNAYKKMTELISETIKDFEGRKVVISHCNNEKDAEIIKKMITEKFPVKEVEIKPMRGLCSYYAMDKGVIVCL